LRYCLTKMLNKLVKVKRNNQTEKAILEAADKVFIQKGFAAARMEDIAKEAGINRALLHYYYRSKDKMFDIIFALRVKEFFSGLGEIIFSEKSLRNKIEAIIEHEITILLAHPYLPIFVLQELNQNPQRMLEHAEKSGAHPAMLLKKFSTDVKAEVNAGTMRVQDATHLFMNIMSMAVYPFVARPILKGILEVDDLGFATIMNNRKREITEFIIHSIKI
jgi:TetR/AcrR family transcriptional regulator